MHVLEIIEADGSLTRVHVRHRRDLVAAATPELRRASDIRQRTVLRTLETSPEALHAVPIGAGRTLSVIVDAGRNASRGAEARQVPFVAAAGADAVPITEHGPVGMLDGYAVVWDYEYPVSDRNGDYLEQFRRGAFTDSLRNRTPIAQYDHGMHPLIGSLPVATWDTVAEDRRGLRVAGPMAEGWMMTPLRDAIRDGRVSGMSIRFAVTRENWSRFRDRRTITGAELYEAGPVALPASSATSVMLRAAARVRTKAQRQAAALNTGR